MPNLAKSAADWEKSLQELASDNCVDLKGKHPRNVVLKAKWDGILNCPGWRNMYNKNKSKVQRTLFGNQPKDACSCGYGDYHGKGMGEKATATAIENNHNPPAEAMAALATATTAIENNHNPPVEAMAAAVAHGAMAAAVAPPPEPPAAPPIFLPFNIPGKPDPIKGQGSKSQIRDQIKVDIFKYNNTYYCI